MTVAISYLFLHSRPSTLILLSCSIVTLGFLIGIFMDGVSVSSVGVAFGVGSSAVTALHAVVIKKSLEIVKGNALHLSWYTNLLCSVVLIPVVLLAGEGPEILDLLFGEDVGMIGAISPRRTFVLGSIVTVRAAIFLSPLS